MTWDLGLNACPINWQIKQKQEGITNNEQPN
jgi:hypothetical protein